MRKVLASLLSDEKPMFSIPLGLTLNFLAFSFFVLPPISFHLLAGFYFIRAWILFS